LPRLDQGELAQGRFVPAHGPDPYRMSPEQVDRERAEAARRWAVRQRIEQAVSAIAIDALEAGKMTDQVIAEISAAADRAAR